MTLLHGMRLTLVLILDVKASETQQGRVAFHVVLVDLWPQRHLPVPTCGAHLTEERLVACPGGQPVSAAKPAIVGAVNGVELIECAIPAVTAHLTAGLALAVNVPIAIRPQPVSPQAMTFWHSTVVVLGQERGKPVTKCLVRRWAHKHADRICLPAAHGAESSLNGRIHPVAVIQVEPSHQDHACRYKHWPIWCNRRCNLSIERRVMRKHGR
jgi:hypothetical protein